MEHECGPRCKNCGSTNVYGLSRVVGYFSSIHNWNGSKIAELRDRQRGNYNVPQGNVFLQGDNKCTAKKQ